MNRSGLLGNAPPGFQGNEMQMSGRMMGVNQGLLGNLPMQQNNMSANLANRNLIGGMNDMVTMANNGQSNMGMAMEGGQMSQRMINMESMQNTAVNQAMVQRNIQGMGGASMQMSQQVGGANMQMNQGINHLNMQMSQSDVMGGQMNTGALIMQSRGNDRLMRSGSVLTPMNQTAYQNEQVRSSVSTDLPFISCFLPLLWLFHLCFRCVFLFVSHYCFCQFSNEITFVTC